MITSEQIVQALPYLGNRPPKYKDEDLIYYFEYTLDGGHVPFGMHGTEAMYEAHKLLYYHDSIVKLINKKYCCTGKEQNEFAALSWEEKKNV